jgi:hypothetical protein
MAEWLKAHAWKACVRETVPWVRIPLSPPVSCSPLYCYRAILKELVLPLLDSRQAAIARSSSFKDGKRGSPGKPPGCSLMSIFAIVGEQVFTHARGIAR